MHDINTNADLKAIEHELAVGRSARRARLGPLRESAGTGTRRLRRWAGQVRRIAVLIAGCWEAELEARTPRPRGDAAGVARC